MNDKFWKIADAVLWLAFKVMLMPFLFAVGKLAEAIFKPDNKLAHANLGIIVFPLAALLAVVFWLSIGVLAVVFVIRKLI